MKKKTVIEWDGGIAFRPVEMIGFPQLEIM